MIDLYFTMAPASENLAKEMFAAGATGVRLTFSYGTPEIQLERARRCKSAAAELGEECKVMADMPGGGARLAQFVYENEGFFMVTNGEVVALVRESEIELSEKSLPVPDVVFESLDEGLVLIVGDGVVSFQVERIDGVLCAVSLGNGRVENNRGVTIQGGSFMPACLTEEDREALHHVSQHEEYDAVALSFVSSVDDLIEAKKLLNGADKMIIAKIETPQGVENINEIAAAADQIMVARGDLALTMPWQEMPRAADRIVEACIEANTPYIMATQVAESMSAAPMLSRAEMTDLWQWKKKEVSGVLLSRETGWGDRPVEAVAAVRTLLDTEL